MGAECDAEGPTSKVPEKYQLQYNFVSHMSVRKMWMSATGLTDGFEETICNSKLISYAV